MSAAATTAVSVNGTGTEYDFYEYKEKAKDQADDSSSAVVAQTSSADVDASLVEADLQRRAKIEASLPKIARGTFMQVIVNPKAHFSAVDAYQPLYGSKPKYVQYLLNVQHDIALLEPLMQKTGVEMISLPRLYRKAAIELDVANLEANGNVSALMVKYKHAEHLAGLDGKPHLILCHLSVQYLGFLFGGQSIAFKIKQTWGKDAIALYTFTVPAQGLLNAFGNEMTKYLAEISDEAYAEFLFEQTIAWQFANDHLGLDTRT